MSTITVRIDGEVEAALAALTSGGSSRSDVVRAAVLEAARALIRAEIEAEARDLAADPEDLAEVRAVQEAMEPLRAW